MYTHTHSYQHVSQNLPTITELNQHSNTTKYKYIYEHNQNSNNIRIQHMYNICVYIYIYMNAICIQHMCMYTYVCVYICIYIKSHTTTIYEHVSQNLPGRTAWTSTWRWPPSPTRSDCDNDIYI